MRSGGRPRNIGNDPPLAFRCVFFFQAEDGIRDVAVTGVQTCALPISKTPSPFAHRRKIHRNDPPFIVFQRWANGDGVFGIGPVNSQAPVPQSARRKSFGQRSEERRVGKECGYWWVWGLEQNKVTI